MSDKTQNIIGLIVLIIVFGLAVFALQKCTDEFGNIDSQSTDGEKVN